MHFARAVTTTLIACLLVAGLADTADAQRRRRRRRRRRRPPPAEPVETPQETPTPVAEDDPAAPPPSPFEDGPPATDVEATETPTEAAPPPEPSEAPTTQYDPGPAPPDVSPIRSDYVALMDDLVQARMRVSSLGAELFRTRLTVDLQDRTGENVTLARVVVHLDGAPVFQNDGPVEGGGSGQEIFTGALAPGPHVLRVELEQRAREDDAYRYTLQQSFRFQVTRERLSEVTLIFEDDSDIASAFPAGGEGRYEVRTRMRVATRALPSQ